jgi:hypothetical protein
MARRKEPKIPDSLLDQLLAGADPKPAFDPNSLLDELKKAFAERALNVETDIIWSPESGNNATVTAGRRWRPTASVSSWRSPATGNQASILSSSPNISRAFRVSTKTSSPCMPSA